MTNFCKTFSFMFSNPARGLIDNSHSPKAERLGLCFILTPEQLLGFSDQEKQQVYFNMDAIIREIKNRRTYSISK